MHLLCSLLRSFGQEWNSSVHKLIATLGPRNPLRTSSWCGLVGTNGRCARLRTSTEDGTCHLETTVLRLRKTNLLTDQDLSFSAPSFRFLSYLHSTSSARAGQNKSPSVGVRLINEQRTRTTHSLRKSFISSHCSLQALYMIILGLFEFPVVPGWLVPFLPVVSQSLLLQVHLNHYRTAPYLESRSEFA